MYDFLNFFGTGIFSSVCLTENLCFGSFYIYRWVIMPPKGYDKKNIKRHITFLPYVFFSKNKGTFKKHTIHFLSESILVFFIFFWSKRQKISI